MAWRRATRKATFARPRRAAVKSLRSVMHRYGHARSVLSRTCPSAVEHNQTARQVPLLGSQWPRRGLSRAAAHVHQLWRGDRYSPLTVEGFRSHVPRQAGVRGLLVRHPVVGGRRAGGSRRDRDHGGERCAAHRVAGIVRAIAAGGVSTSPAGCGLWNRRTAPSIRPNSPSRGGASLRVITSERKEHGSRTAVR
jgi:hypothetical protein